MWWPAPSVASMCAAAAKGLQMPRSHGGLFDELVTISARLPWWLALLLAAIAFLILHSIASHELAPPTDPQSVGPLARAQLLRTLALFGQYLFPAAFAGGAVLSVFGRWKRRRLHGDAAGDAGPAALQAMSWDDFELLVGEAFRRQGYRVRELGGDGPDGGVDLVAARDEQHYLVQCKHWKSRQVGVRTVRELYGVMTAQQAAGAFVVTSGVFTREARAFAYDKNVLLIDGAQLLRLLRVGRREAGEYHLLGTEHPGQGLSDAPPVAGPPTAASWLRWCAVRRVAAVSCHRRKRARRQPRPGLTTGRGWRRQSVHGAGAAGPGGSVRVAVRTARTMCPAGQRPARDRVRQSLYPGPAGVYGGTSA
jgi:restriction system protein